MNITGILAHNHKLVIGHEGSIPWAGRAKDDVQRFWGLINSSVVIMGRKTFDTFRGNALGGCVNVVVTSRPNVLVDHPMVHLVADFKEALLVAAMYPHLPVFFIGGAGVWNAALPHLTHLEMTLIDDHSDGDTKLPYYAHLFDAVSHRSHVPEDPAQLPMWFTSYVRNGQRVD